MELSASILVLAFIVERLVEIITNIFPQLNKIKVEKVNVKMLLTLIISLVVCIGANIDILQLIEVDVSMPYLGNVFSAILMSGGSEILHDIIDWIKANKDKAKYD
jgi:hypothetical protein